MADTRECKILITGDATGLTAASGQGAAALKGVEEATNKCSEAAEKHTTHLHAMHKVFHALNAKR